MDYLKALNWRYATRQFSETELDQEVIERLVEAARLAPSSYGVQPYRLLLIKDKALREQLVEHSFGQDKVRDSSHLAVFATSTASGDALLAQHMARVKAARPELSTEQLVAMEQSIGGTFASFSAEQLLTWSTQQTFIALGHFICAAALEGVDACPMGGFVPQGYDEVLGLADKALTASVICTLGERHGDDSSAGYTKVRVAEQDFVTYR